LNPDEFRIFLFLQNMSFASCYLESRTLLPVLIGERPSDGLGLIVMIPACNETELLKTIRSLAACEPPRCAVEVIVVMNEAEGCPEHISRQNGQALLSLQDWKDRHPEAFFTLYPVYPLPFPQKHAGVGRARKTGMDEAVRRFHLLGKPEGIIVSLDADTLVAENYLTAIEALFCSGLKPVGTTIRFRHRTDELEDEQHREGMMLYETYLHYYKQALAYSGYPHAIYTIGSAFAVRADAYVKQGGMNQRQAGEDFYFLHKLTQLGQVIELNTTCVYPSARVSGRVPFGTGAALQKWVNGEEKLRQTYSFRSFADLKAFFQLLPRLYTDDRHAGKWEIALPVSRFLDDGHFADALSGIKQNSASLTAFTKRFFQYFNAFRILKFLNFAHPHHYPYQDLHEAVCELKEATRAGS